MALSDYAHSQWGSFRSFAFKGNVIDLAVGVVIGAAFGQLVDALVEGIIMPLVAVVLPTEEAYRNWNVALEGQQVLYGAFLAELVNFFIIAIVLWLFVRKLIRRQAAAPPPPPPTPTKQEQLLTEIRDLLRER